jgi:hypothetical protein
VEGRGDAGGVLYGSFIEQLAGVVLVKSFFGQIDLTIA